MNAAEIARASREMREIRRALHGDHGVSPSEVELMHVLSHGATTGTDICWKTGMTFGNASEAIQGLVVRGYVRRSPGRDRRSHLLALTEQGACALEAIK